MKILTLALHETAIEGEWQAAAVRFISGLRKKRITAESLLSPTATPKPARSKHSSFFVMPFGKYKGQLISAMPDAYLIWLMENADLREPLLSHLEDELERRGL